MQSACYLPACKHLITGLIFICSGSVVADIARDAGDKAGLWLNKPTPPLLLERRYLPPLIALQQTHLECCNSAVAEFTHVAFPDHHSRSRTPSELHSTRRRNGRSGIPARPGSGPPADRQPTAADFADSAFTAPSGP